MDGHRILFACLVANPLGGLALWVLIDKFFWPAYFRKRLKAIEEALEKLNPEGEADKVPLADLLEKKKDIQTKKASRNSLTFLVGCVERILYIVAIYIGAWPWIGFWIGIKVAIRWRNQSDTVDGSSDNIWLLGTAFSVALGYLCACIAHNQWPILYPIQK